MRFIKGKDWKLNQIHLLSFFIFKRVQLFCLYIFARPKVAFCSFDPNSSCEHFCIWRCWFAKYSITDEKIIGCSDGQSVKIQIAILSETNGKCYLTYFNFNPRLWILFFLLLKRCLQNFVRKFTCFSKTIWNHL